MYLKGFFFPKLKSFCGYLKVWFSTLSDLLATKRILFFQKKTFFSAKKTFFCAGGLIFAAALIFAGGLKTTAALIFAGGLNICCYKKKSSFTDTACLRAGHVTFFGRLPRGPSGTIHGS